MVIELICEFENFPERMPLYLIGLLTKNGENLVVIFKRIRLL